RDMAKNIILPKVVEAYSCALKTNEMALNQGFPGVDAYVKSLGEGCKDLMAAIANVEKALAGEHEHILAAMAETRKIVDALEKVVSDEMWPLPKYREMMFIY
ncbi:MAG: glutamine synthetase type III, partial [Fibrobacter sp.]|nr:glutamine synthetase type III [Fibrobacter sp.]